MWAYRLTPEKYANELSGVGASLYGGRWNELGVEMIYCAEHASLALCEMLVHLNKRLKLAPIHLLKIQIPDKYPIHTIKEKDLNEHWQLTKNIRDTQQLGTELIIDNKYLAIKVPSAILPMESNIIINPMHPKFRYVKIVESNPFIIDSRLVKV